MSVCGPFPEGILQHRKLTFSLAWSPFLLLLPSRPEELITSKPHLVFIILYSFLQESLPDSISSRPHKTWMALSEDSGTHVLKGPLL